jgi:hypothetical protein
MSIEELITAGFNINSKYEALVSLPFLVENMSETVEQYYIRCDEVIQNLIKSTEPKGNNNQNIHSLYSVHYSLSLSQ